MTIASDVTELIGHTPMVRLSRFGCGAGSGGYLQDLSGGVMQVVGGVAIPINGVVDPAIGIVDCLGTCRSTS